MEEIKKIWEKQRSFNDNFMNTKEASTSERQAHTKEIVLHMISECDELLSNINWKFHRKETIENIDRNKILEQLVDIFKYSLTLAQTWNVEPEELITEFYRKSEVVEQKYKQEKKLSLLTDEKVIGIDIDGVLADYPNGFIKFISEETKTDLSKVVLNKYDLYTIISDKIPGGAETLRKLKHKFRIEGHKKNLEVIPGAIDGMKYLKEKGYTIVLLTARPAKEYPRIFSDTIEWLKKYNIPYDAILFDEDKEKRIIKEFPNMKFMIEDAAQNANKIAPEGYKVFLLEKSYNNDEFTHRNVVRVNNWEDLIKWI